MSEANFFCRMVAGVSLCLSNCRLSGLVFLCYFASLFERERVDAYGDLRLLSMAQK